MEYQPGQRRGIQTITQLINNIEKINKQTDYIIKSYEEKINRFKKNANNALTYLNLFEENYKNYKKTKSQECNQLKKIFTNLIISLVLIKNTEENTQLKSTHHGSGFRGFRGFKFFLPDNKPKYYIKPIIKSIRNNLESITKKLDKFEIYLKEKYVRKVNNFDKLENLDLNSHYDKISQNKIKLEESFNSKIKCNTNNNTLQIEGVSSNHQPHPHNPSPSPSHYPYIPTIITSKKSEETESSLNRLQLNDNDIDQIIKSLNDGIQSLCEIYSIKDSEINSFPNDLKGLENKLQRVYKIINDKKIQLSLSENETINETISNLSKINSLISQESQVNSKKSQVNSTKSQESQVNSTKSQESQESQVNSTKLNNVVKKYYIPHERKLAPFKPNYVEDYITNHGIRVGGKVKKNNKKIYK